MTEKSSPPPLDNAPSLLPDIPEPIQLKREARAVHFEEDNDGEVEEAVPQTIKEEEFKQPTKTSKEVLKTGADYSDLLISDRDDGDPSLTFRSVILLTLSTALCSASAAIASFRPVSWNLTGILIYLIIFFIGKAWYRFLPTKDSFTKKFLGGEEVVQKSKWLSMISKIIHFINPHDFGIKEHGIISTTSQREISDISNTFIIQLLFFRESPLTNVDLVCGNISVAFLGFAFAPLFRSMLVYPSEMVWYGALPDLAFYQTLHWEPYSATKYKAFWIIVGGGLLYEFVPVYMMPWISAISIPCLAAIKTKGSLAMNLNNIFGGSVTNQGMGLFAFCLDWQYIGSSCLTLPVAWQVSVWISWLIGIPTILALYYNNTWGANDLPFLSANLFAQNGTKYDILAVLDDSVLNEDRLQAFGIPRLPASSVWKSIGHISAVGALFSWITVFYGKQLYIDFKKFRKGEQKDLHYAAMQKYKETPWWWYAFIGVIAFACGIVVCIRGNTGLTIGAYIFAIVLGFVMIPLSGTLDARLGSGVITTILFKMIASAISPGRPLAMLYFVSFSHGFLGQAVNQLSFLKIGQYLKIPPRVLFLSQAYGLVVVTVVEQVIINTITSTQKDALLLDEGTSQWSGVSFRQSYVDVVTWSMSKYLYGPRSPYFIVPMSFVLGFGMVFIYALVYSFQPTIRGYDIVQHFNLPIFLTELGDLVGAINSSKMTFVGISMIGQWARTHRPYLYNRYMYISSAGIDAATGITVFFCSLVFFGAFGRTIPFPTWFGNPDGHLDHCPDVKK